MNVVADALSRTEENVEPRTETNAELSERVLFKALPQMHNEPQITDEPRKTNELKSTAKPEKFKTKGVPRDQELSINPRMRYL